MNVNQQIFSTGQIKLNIDGTHMLDSKKGNTIRVYDKAEALWMMLELGPAFSGGAVDVMSKSDTITFLWRGQIWKEV